MIRKIGFIFCILITSMILVSCGKNNKEDKLAFTKISSFYYPSDEFLELSKYKDVKDNKVLYYYYNFEFLSDITDENVISEVLIIVVNDEAFSFNLIDKNKNKSTYDDFIYSKENNGLLKTFSEDEFTAEMRK